LNIPITANVAVALRQLRPSRTDDEAILLWIDAICIDQENNQERESQVLLMKQIFDHARETIVWLGEGQESTGAYASCITQLNKHYSYQQPDLRLSLESVGYRPWRLDDVHPAYIRKSAWIDFKRLLEQPWFSRVWVFQEVAVSTHITMWYGKDMIQWKELCEACMAIELYNLDIDHLLNQPPHTEVLIMHETQLSYARRQMHIPSGARHNQSPGGTSIKFRSRDGTVLPRLDICYS
jgi:hypothetical protein